jgi:hypothetical protein
MNSCTNGRSIVKMPALPMPTKIRKNTRKSQPGITALGPGVKTMMPVASDIMTADQMNTVRRPIRSPSQPQMKAPGTAPRPEANRIAPPCQ